MQKPTLLVALALALAALLTPAEAQVVTRPHLPWRTVRTGHFDVHYPESLREWTLDIASRLDAVHAEVAALVGYAPRERITIVVEDPSTQANGFAFPFRDDPAIVLWPTPPDPRSAIGNYRDAAEQLAVHEFAHVAHLARPSRNPRQRLFARLLPVKLGPVARKAPRWVTEGYATLIEGRLTGSGRPHSVIRAAVLRQWALEGRLPSYGQLSSTSGFYGGAMAYLAGSAFLEWLQAQRGDSSLVHLWRRMSARRDRSFADAFTGVFGGPPHELYGRFTVEVTAAALEARRTLAAAGLVEGDTVQRLAWSTGDPAVSPGGDLMATVLRGAPGRPSRVVVWKTADEPGDSAARAAAEKLRRLDPEDVPDVRWRPPPKRAVATLHPAGGRGYDAPRFVPGGERILVVRSDPVPEGGTRPDLFVWEWKNRKVRRLTRGAGIRWADPAPNGARAAAVQCLDGSCDLVLVDLGGHGRGAVTTLVDAPVDVAYHRPRWSPDGSWIVAAVQQDGRWRLQLVEPGSGYRRFVGPDDGASRYDAAFLPGGTRLVTVSEAGGVANLEIIDLETGQARPLTRTTGAALAPEPDPTTGDVFYLSLHAGGLDLRRLHPDSARAGPLVALSPALTPVAPPRSTPRDTLPRAELPPPRPYGVGPRGFRLLAGGVQDADGGAVGVLLANGDPIGRLTWMLQASGGERGVPAGAALNAVWRGWPAVLGGDLFAMRHEPSRGPGPLDDVLDADYRGAVAYAELPWPFLWMRGVRVGASVGELELEEGGTVPRRVWFGGYGWRLTRTRPSHALLLDARFHGAHGETGDAEWDRELITVVMGARLGRLNARMEVTYAEAYGDLPEWERFTVGGSLQPLFEGAVLNQRIPMPAIPFGTLRADTLTVARLSASVGGLTPYWWSAELEDGTVYDVVGVEVETSVPGFSLLSIPRVRLLAGVGYPLDAPFRHELQTYFSLTYRP
jgi:hypothetical protein